MKKLALTGILGLLLLISAQAQEYSTGIGIRGGFSNGLTVKHFLSETKAVEGILATRWNGFYITGLYEIQNIAFDTPGLYWFYGVGGHLGSINGNNSRFNDGVNHTLLGIDAILGLEYCFNELPISLSLDWKPTFDLIGDSDVGFDNGAFSIRYIF
jgi:hypothetical protein